MDNSQKVLQKTKQLKDKVEAFNNLVSKWEDTLVLIDLANEENDESMLPDVVSATEEIEADIDKMTLETLLSMMESFPCFILVSVWILSHKDKFCYRAVICFNVSK